MKLIMDIDEEIYKASKIINVQYEDVVQIPLEAIANGTPIPDNATNGDALKVMFPKIEINESSNIIKGFFNLRKTNPKTVSFFDKDWWNTLYQKGGKE